MESLYIYIYKKGFFEYNLKKKEIYIFNKKKRVVSIIIGFGKNKIKQQNVVLLFYNKLNENINGSNLYIIINHYFFLCQ